LPSTSPAEIARGIFEGCLAGGECDPGRIDELAALALDRDEDLARSASRALFTGLAERLADLFEPRLCAAYARLFARVLETALPEARGAGLIGRYEEVRRVRRPRFEPRRVVVLSRVTLGADVAVTSVLMDAVRRRFPRAGLIFAGPRKAWELFERSPRWRHLDLPYGRTAPLGERLSVFTPLREALDGPSVLLVDPDSRLTQLGLLPVCPAERHHLFESRGYGGEGDEPLPVLAARWAGETFGIEDAEPWLHPKHEFDFGAMEVAAVSLGVGENPAKRIADPFEADLLALLAARPGLVMADIGAPGSEEETRVRRAIAQSGAAEGRIGIHEGSFASFAAMIAASRLYAGYDSAGQHVAAALGVPLVTAFAGAASDRMMARWTPHGPGPRRVLKLRSGDPAGALSAVRDAVETVLAASSRTTPAERP
jgi:ADP-heptose:LPS heptosyltransferase